MLRYLSLFSGIEAASCAWAGLPMQLVGLSEIEPFPCNVLARRFPDVPNLGDVTAINPHDLRKLGHIDLIVGGSPCQGFSVAGFRKGLDDVRSKLALNYIEIIRCVHPQWVLWENVPGVLSSGKGLDFKHFITELAGCGYSLAWRVLNAKYFGVPQSRRRIFLVGYRGETSTVPEQVLFEPTWLSGDTAQSEGTQQITATDAEGLIRTADQDLCLDISHRCDVVRYYHKDVPCLTARMGTGGNNIPLVFADVNYHTYKQTEIGSALRASGGALGGGSENLVASPENLRIRKLTPKECLRLQGFPDYWFDDVDLYSDTAAYKAIGNSMAVPVMRWIGERICAEHAKVSGRLS